MSLLDYVKLRSISCPICSSRLDHNPKKLSCHHTFCEKDLTLLLSIDNTLNMVTCPICQQTTPVPDGNVSSLNINETLQSRIQDLANLRQLCTNCDLNQGSIAETYCQDCNLFMCRKCLCTHNSLKPNRNHHTFLVEDIKKGKVFLDNKVPCRDHTGDEGRRVCTLVCITCKKAICEECRDVVHGEHNVKTLSEYNAESQIHLQDLHSKADTAMGNAKRRIESGKREESTASNHMNHVIGSTLESAVTVVKEVEVRRDILIKLSEDHKQTINLKYLESRKPDEKMFAQIESARELLKRSTSCQFSADTAAIRTSLRHRLKGMLTGEVDEEDYSKRLAEITQEATKIKFIPDDNKLLLGHITYDNVNMFPQVSCRITRSTSAPAMPGASSDVGQSHTWELSQGIALPKESPMQCLTATPDGKVAVGTKRTGIIIYPSGDHIRRKSGTPRLSDVSGLAFTSKGSCVVRTRRNKIAVFTPHWEKLEVRFQTVITAWTFLKRGPCGNVTLDGDDYIYVNHIRDKKIEVFAVTGGKPLRTIPCRGFKPQDIFAMKSRKMLVVSTGDESVILIDECGCIRNQINKAYENVFCALRPDDSILLARVKLKDCLLTIEHYSQDLDLLGTIISDQKITVQTNDWFALQETSDGDIAFCTSGRLYLFSRSFT